MNVLHFVFDIQLVNISSAGPPLDATHKIQVIFGGLNHSVATVRSGVGYCILVQSIEQALNLNKLRCLDYLLRLPADRLPWYALLS